MMSSFGEKTHQQFLDALTIYFEGCQKINAASRGNLPKGNWKIEWLQKRVRIMHDGGAHSFVDMATGDVLKPATWKAPAKHARGNIYDDKHGLGSMGPYGPAYLRTGLSWLK